MQCLSCRAINDDREERCARCGRRLHPASPRPAPESYVAQSGAATAPAFETFEGGHSGPAEPAQVQPSLFRDAWTGAKVIPIPTLTPLRMPAERHRRPAQRTTSGQRAARRAHDSQQRLEFEEAAATYAPPDEAIYCAAPVAPPPHRLLATAIDASFIVVAVGCFLAVFSLSGGHLAVTSQTLPWLLGVPAALTFLYRALWCLAGGDSPGMRFSGLRLVDFDGRTPTREQRGLRQIASLLSVVSAGLGLVWALVDEEKLTWHDHISKTFPTSG